MQKIVVLFVLFFMNIAVLQSQGISLNDSTITYKNKEGKILSREELQELTKEKFDMKTETLADGKKVITIIPSTPAKMTEQEQLVANIKKGYLGHPLEDFSFTDVNHKKIEKKDLAGKVIVINFWFTTCTPCIAEIPLLNEVVEAYKGKNVVFIAPGLNEEKSVNKFLLKYPFQYSVVADQNAYADKMKVEVFPTHLITDKNGIIKQVVVGYHADIKEQLGKAIDWLL